MRTQLGPDVSARHFVLTALAAAALLLLAAALPLGAQEEEEEEPGWSLEAELSFVMTSGNAESTTLGAGAGLRRIWERMRWRLEAGGLRTESSEVTRRAVGTADDFEVIEESESRVTAENYHARTRLDRSLSERTFAYGGVSWNRNTFAGIDARWTLVIGTGLVAIETSRSHLRVDLGGSYTAEDPVTGDSDEFVGLRLSWDFGRQLTESAEFTSILVLDESLEDVDDLRGDFTNALAVSINDALALRTSLQLLYDNQPALVDVPLFAPDGEPTGETVRGALDELDTLLTVALVLSL